MSKERLPRIKGYCRDCEFAHFDSFLTFKVGKTMFSCCKIRIIENIEYVGMLKQIQCEDEYCSSFQQRKGNKDDKQ
jgi:hypothetical protein